MGFIMGSLVGGSFGAFIGLYTAFQTRRLVAIPLSIVVSGAGFGFVLACGSLIRNDTPPPSLTNPHPHPYLNE